MLLIALKIQIVFSVKLKCCLILGWLPTKNVKLKYCKYNFVRCQYIRVVDGYLDRIVAAPLKFTLRTKLKKIIYRALMVTGDRSFENT